MGNFKYKKEHKEWRKIIIERDKKCLMCNKEGKYLNAHHLIPKDVQAYRYNPDNGITLCPRCHTLGKDSAHKHPIKFTLWLEKNFPDKYWWVFERL